MTNAFSERIRGLAAQLAQSLHEGVEDADKTEVFRRDSFEAICSKGIAALHFPKAFGGMELPYALFLSAIEEIAAVDAGIAVALSVHSGLAGNVIIKYGSIEIHEEWLPQMATGKALVAYALTEPDAGSDPSRIRTTAKKKGDEWVLNGEKMWITSGANGDLSVLYALAEVDGVEKGITAFVVPHTTEGFSSEKISGKLGIRTSDTAALVLKDVRIPDSHRLGEIGRGHAIALEALDGGRLGISAVSLGIHRAARDEMIRYAQEREQFGRPIAGFQLIQEMIADVVTDYEAGRLLLRCALEAREKGRYTKEASISKLFTSEAAMHAADRCVQVHGGYGYSSEFPAERFFRDARVLTLFEGTSEIQRLLIGRLVTGVDAFGSR
ncbi:acyl-CoA dehydrogenase family protein [bacterium]|nr:acyl-CoA dehydrogenase family protein [bacterium]